MHVVSAMSMTVTITTTTSVTVFAIHLSTIWPSTPTTHPPSLMLLGFWRHSRRDDHQEKERQNSPFMNYNKKIKSISMYHIIRKASKKVIRWGDALACVSIISLNNRVTINCLELALSWLIHNQEMHDVRYKISYEVVTKCIKAHKPFCMECN
jgi:hypothetical protein